MSIVDTNLTVGFGTSDTSSSDQISIKIHPGFVPAGVYVQVEIYPIHPDMIVRVTKGGTITKASGFTQSVTIEEEFIALGGGTSFSPSNPIDTLISVDKNEGFYFDEEGNSIPASQVSFFYNPDTKTIDSNIPLIGYVTVSYSYTYGLWDYTPRPPSRFSQYGFLTELGVVFAFLNKNHASLIIEPAPLPDKVKIEVLTLWSNILVSERGGVPSEDTEGVLVSAFEKPPGWDAANKSGAYPSKTFQLPTSLQVYEQKRDHSKWYYTGNSYYLKEEHLAFPLEYPYNDHHNFANGNIVSPSGNLFTPQYTLDIVDLSSINNYQLLSSNKDKAIRMVQDMYVYIANTLGL